MIYELKLPEGEPVAIVTCNESTDTFEMELTDSTERAPMIIEWLRRDGIRKPRQDLTQWFIQERVVPPNRLFIDDILKNMGLNSYSIHGILNHTHGACDMDDFLLIPVDNER